MKNALILSLFLVFISGCGFKPVYSKVEDSKGIHLVKLNHIKASKLPTKLDLEFKRAINQAFEVGANNQAAKYYLNINLVTTSQNLDTQNNSTSTRTRLIMYINYELYNIETNRLEVKDRFIASDSFQVDASPYSTFISEEQTGVNMAKSIAEEIKIRLMGKLERLN
jgi:hypothetical protein